MRELNYRLNRYRMKCTQLKKSNSIMRVVIYILSFTIIINLIAISIFYYDSSTKKQELSRLEGQMLSLIEELKIYEREERISTYKGKFTITSYCSCEICCGEWAEDRPMLGEKELVITSSGSIAEQGITVAVDPDVIPYGTKIYIEGIGVRVAQDTGKDIKGNKLDVYYNDHEVAKNEGIYNRDVWILNESD